MGRRNQQAQGSSWIETADLARAPGHLFYQRLNDLLEGALRSLDEEVHSPVFSRPLVQLLLTIVLVNRFGQWR